MRMCVTYVAAWTMATALGAWFAGAPLMFVGFGVLPFVIGMWLGYHEGEQAITDQVKQILQDVGHK